MAKSIQFTKVYDFPVKKMWNALTDPQALSEWLMPCDFLPKIGHEFTFRTKSYPGFNGIVDCRVLELKEMELLSFSWSGGSLSDSVVTFRLVDLDGKKTRLDFEHSGFKGLMNTFLTRKILSNGWKGKILTVQLQKYLENE
ncbi:MAG: hypothetical protein CML04_01505 [Pseudozobellia sp.]|nr:hypothetical protein [Pseudozobellia sp.]MBG48859.1 hypothetical protein [Pseudozobellia sp.]|tara:strand:+ start:26 stop:448 length:423 start_codon:yes stop_codon:yes gene_type:complete